MYYCDQWETPIGKLVAVCHENQLVFLSTTNTEFCCIKPEYEKQHPILRMVHQQVQEYFEGKRRFFDLPTQMRGTEFQKRVWSELLKIPYGKTVCYQDIAERIGNNKASRAVGAACKKNPIILVVPCHRVVGKDQRMIGFSAGGILVKQQLIHHESAGLE